MVDITQIAEHVLPVVPIRDGIVFPGTEMILTFGRQRSVSAIEAAQSSGKRIILVMQRNPNINDPTPSDLYQVGSVGEIVQMMKNEGEINALVRGIAKVTLSSFEAVEPFFVARAHEINDEMGDDEQTKALFNHLTAELRQAVKLGKTMDFLTFMNIMSGVTPLTLSYQVAGVLDIKPAERQELLEMNSVRDRLEREVSYLGKEVKVLELERKIASKTNEKFEKNMREQVLRERMKTIEKELGEDDENKETKELAEKIKKSGMPGDVRTKAEKELSRLAQMSQYNPESSYVRTYLDWLVELPWAVGSTNDVNIRQAEKVLDTDHYGLKKIKERILEYLAVMQLRAKAPDEAPKEKNRDEGTKKRASKSAPTILCFVGPPGVGKTSIGRSIARSLGRKFVKMSLGGIRDEAEIRGHRRTYVGAMPGRIIQSIKQAGTNNPVFMLDEIDKVGTDFRGDPSSALLEALDPEQNFAFSDHYLEVPFDLSDVFFITTCNVLETIPPALRDRLEIIHFAGYTEEEKFHIGKDFLLEKQRMLHGIPKGKVKLTDKAITEIIRKYTREAGVRNLERQIAAFFRKVAKKIAESNGRGKRAYMIGPKDLHEYLGPYKFTSYLAEKKDEAGMVTGLAWTEAGGDILFIEVALMPGKGSLILTGQLGDVMKESGQAALSYVRSKWRTLGLPEKFFQKIDIHVHVPEGAVPKDGPSAGAAIGTAIVSALTKIPTKRTMAMTGEITLRGRVLEIGGVKEKVIAAHRAGIKTVILPKNNKKDLEDIPKSVLSDLTFHFVDHMDEVLKIALTKPLPYEGSSVKAHPLHLTA
jgi:ATP-dependent Lon protease